MNIWMIGFFLVYALLMLVVYFAYGKHVIRKLMKSGYYYQYHILDTGETGWHVFNEGENKIKGGSRIFCRERLYHGTQLYEDMNAEPLKIERDIGKYRYYCDTKNFDTIVRNDILETLLILRAKDIIVLLIVVSIVAVILVGIGNWYFTHNTLESMKSTIELIANQTSQQNSGGIIIRG